MEAEVFQDVIMVNLESLNIGSVDFQTPNNCIVHPSPPPVSYDFDGTGVVLLTLNAWGSGSLTTGLGQAGSASVTGGGFVIAGLRADGHTAWIGGVHELYRVDSYAQYVIPPLFGGGIQDFRLTLASSTGCGGTTEPAYVYIDNRP